MSLETSKEDDNAIAEVSRQLKAQEKRISGLERQVAGLGFLVWLLLFVLISIPVIVIFMKLTAS